MTSHWTYRENTQEDDDLEQGDILLPNVALRRLFAEVHPHFLDPKYNAFMVVTQSCDLARGRRGPECKADYINLAVIRPLQDMLPAFIKSICGPEIDGIFKKSKKGEANQFLGRLFNQNEQAMGLFYLHPDNEHASIALPSVVLLRVTIALRAPEHYGTLVAARRGRLHQDFHGKLGWLVGNLYSRIGTRDWDEKSLKEMIKHGLDLEDVVWTEDILYDRAQEKQISFVSLSKAEKLKELEQLTPIAFKDRLSEETGNEARKLINRMISEIKKELEDRDETEALPFFVQQLIPKLEHLPETLEKRVKNIPLYSRAVDKKKGY